MLTTPAGLAQTPFYTMWSHLPELRETVDPFHFPQRLALYRLLIASSNPNGLFGADNTFNVFWGYVFQAHWQWRSGRYHRHTPPSEQIDPHSIWCYSNCALCVIPYIAAVQSGLAPALTILPPATPTRVAYAHGGGQGQAYSVPELYQPALAAWRNFFALLQRTPTGGDLEPLRFELWHAHEASLSAAHSGQAPLEAAYARNELDFLQGWVRMVDFFGAAAWRTDLEFMLKNGLDMLPERLLTDADQPGAMADMSSAVNLNVKSVFDLVRLPQWRFNLNLWLWRRAMRSRAARDNVLAMLAATFNPTPANQAERRQLLGYVLRL